MLIAWEASSYMHEESRLEHRKQLGQLPGSLRSRGLHLGHRSFEREYETRPLPPRRTVKRTRDVGRASRD